MGKKSKSKTPKVDGLDPSDLKKLHRAVRLVWSWSTAPRLVRKRCTREDGFQYCEGHACVKKGRPVPKVFVDHIEAVGEVGGPRYIQRMFVPSSKLQGLCKDCHDPKTNTERKAKKVKSNKSQKAKPRKKALKVDQDDDESFYLRDLV